MYKDTNTNESKIEISIIQILSTIIIVVMAFVLPVQLISYLQIESIRDNIVYSRSAVSNRTDNSPRVAGETNIQGQDLGTTNTSTQFVNQLITIPIINKEFYIDNETKILGYVGAGLCTTSLALFIYLRWINS